MEDVYCVVTFFTTNYALDFEKKAKKEGIDVRLMPVPRELSSSCGTAARINCDERDRVEKFCEESSIEYDGIHEVKRMRKKSLLDRFKRG